MGSFLESILVPLLLLWIINSPWGVSSFAPTPSFTRRPLRPTTPIITTTQPFHLVPLSSLPPGQSFIVILGGDDDDDEGDNTEKDHDDDDDDEAEDEEHPEDPYTQVAKEEFEESDVSNSPTTSALATLNDNGKLTTLEDWGGALGKLRQRVDDVETGKSQDPSHALFRLMSSESPNQVIGKFVTSANPQTVQAMSGAVSSLLGGT